MYNCVKLFINGRQFGIFQRAETAEFVKRLLDEAGLVYDWSIKEVFVDGVGF